MAKLWNGSNKDRLQVLREWVLSGENADKSKSAIVLQRRSLQRNDANEECLTLQQMFERKIPIEKIRAVVAKGGGIPDKDAPNVAKLTAYWIETSRTRLNREDRNQTAEFRGAATAASTLDSLELGNAGPLSAVHSDIESLVSQAQEAANLGQPAASGGRAPKAKAKARGRKESGVTEERPTNEDDLRALLSTTLKKEMTACNTIALDLPKGHNLRKSLLQYKQRFEDAVDELKAMKSMANLQSLDSEVRDDVSKVRMIKAQARAVVSELRKG